jgi:signal transduction histidine kinase
MICHCKVEGTAIDKDFMAYRLFRIVQEGLRNAVKHRRAKSVRIALCGCEGQVQLMLEDDGIGLRKKLAENQGLGLRIMRYRAAALNAVFSIESAQTGGVVVTCTQSLPVLRPELTVGNSTGS